MLAAQTEYSTLEVGLVFESGPKTRNRKIICKILVNLDFFKIHLLRRLGRRPLLAQVIVAAVTSAPIVGHRTISSVIHRICRFQPIIRATSAVYSWLIVILVLDVGLFG